MTLNRDFASLQDLKSPRFPASVADRVDLAFGEVIRFGYSRV